MTYMFSGPCALINLLEYWTSKVEHMGSMLDTAKKFDQDISFWCVTLTPEEPMDFTQEQDPLKPENKPKWGTCPERPPVAAPS
jgi:hypothetical protein